MWILPPPIALAYIDTTGLEGLSPPRRHGERRRAAGEPRSELVVSSQSLFFTTLMALRMTAFFGITGP